jgi:hypothetical protein
MVIVFRMVELILGVWREGGLNGRGVAGKPGRHASRHLGNWQREARRRRVYWRTAKTRQDLAVNGLQKTSHSAASTEKEQSLTFSLNYDA